VFPHGSVIGLTLFFVHNHAFAFLLFPVLILVDRIVPSFAGGWLTFAAWVYFPYYLFVSMRPVYGQSRLCTFTKLTVLPFSYFICIAITAAITAMYSVWSI
jgi:hypothetical protein